MLMPETEIPVPTALKLSPSEKLALPQEAENSDLETLTVSPAFTTLNLRVSISFMSVP